VKSKLRAIVPLAATAFFLWLSLRNVESWSAVWTNVRHAHAGYFALALLIATLTIHVRALRWKTLLHPIAPDFPLRPRIASTAVGLTANNLLPARAGEFARALVCARLGKLPLASVFGTLALERMLDAVAIVSILVGVIAIEGFPGEAEAVVAAKAGARIAVIGAVVLILMLGTLVAFPHRAVAVADRLANRFLPERARRRVVDALHAFLGGLAVLRSPRLLATSLAWAYGQWAFLALSFYFGFKAFGIEEPGYAGALFLQSCVGLAVALPSSPGFVGVFHAAAVYGLALYGVDADRAASFAIAFHMGGWIGVNAVGVYYFSRLGLTWRELMGAEEKVEDEVEREDPAAAANA
jgi:glycosyltransferase 2 family protein